MGVRGVRWMRGVMPSVCGLSMMVWCIAAQAQEPADATRSNGATDETHGTTHAMVPPELAFVSDDDDIEAQSGAMVPPELAVAAYGDDEPTDAPDDVSSDAAFYDRYRRFNTVDGTTGGFRLADPSTGAIGAFRVQLATAFMSSSDYLRAGDDVDVTNYALSLSWTATDTIELFAALNSRAADHEVPAAVQVGSNRTQNLSSTGDLSFGMKVGGHVGGVVSLGGDARVLLQSGEGQGSPELSATGLALRASMAVDLRRQPEPVPFVARFNLGYRIDNSAVLAEAREASRYAQLPSPRVPADETRHLANRFERLAFAMNRVDMLGVGVGVEVPLHVASDFYLHPLVEWSWGIPINRQAYDCAHLDVSGVGTRSNFEDSCLSDEGVAAWPMTVTLGLRVVTPVRGLSAFAGLDIGLTGASRFVRELAPTLPYAVLLGISADYDARPAPVRIVDREVPVEVVVPPPSRGRVRGLVVDAQLGVAVNGASVRVEGSDVSAIQSDEAGRFVTAELSPGEVRYQVTHPDYEASSCVSSIGAEGGDVEARCTLNPLSRKGTLTLRVTDAWGSPVAGANVQLSGPIVANLQASTDGVVSGTDLAPGQYTARVDGANHYLRITTIAVVARHTTQSTVVLTPRAGVSRAELKGAEIRLTGTVRFARGSSTIDATLAPVVADLADLLLRNPQVLRIRIEGPTDTGGDPALAQTRALAVQQRLIDAGVDAARIAAVGGQSPKLRIVVE